MKNVIQVYEGVDGIKKVYEMCLDVDKADFVCTSENYSDVVGDWYDNDFAPRLKKSTVEVRELLPSDVQDSKNERMQFLPSNYKAEADVIVTPEYVAIVTYNPENPGAIVMRDAEVIKAMKQMFEAAWMR